MKQLAATIILLALPLAACWQPASEPQAGADIDPDDPEYWVQALEANRAERSYEYLLTCWGEQWPDDVKATYNAPPEQLATQEEIAAAIAATHENCNVEKMVRTDQIKIDLAREGVPIREIEAAAAAQLETELAEMFQDYWAR